MDLSKGNPQGNAITSHVGCHRQVSSVASRVCATQSSERAAYDLHIALFMSHTLGIKKPA